jgi:mono/diheme cytochrome c family protein
VRSRLKHRLLFILLLAGCGRRPIAGDDGSAQPAEPLRLADRFAKDAAFRRDCLVRSLENQQNQYARERITRYTPEDWGQLRVADFKTRPVRPADVGRPAPVPDETWQAIPVGNFPDTPNGLTQRGGQMLSCFPAQLEQSMLPVLRDPGGPARYGLWQTDESVGGLVWVALPGGVFPALTCSSCHASPDKDGKLRAGVPHHLFDIGKAKDDAIPMHGLYSTWGPGREDIAADGQDNPVVMADLRPVRFQSHLHRTANIKNSLVALALRVETGIITAYSGKARPEPRDAFALAYFLWTLGDTLDTQAPLHHPGRTVFEQHCATCHQGSALAGPPILPATIASPLAGMPNTARGTGKVRVPSLLGVSARRRLLYGGEANGIDDLLDPARKLGGHTMGNSLTGDERQAIAAYLKSL